MFASPVGKNESVRPGRSPDPSWQNAALEFERTRPHHSGLRSSAGSHDRAPVGAGSVRQLDESGWSFAGMPLFSGVEGRSAIAPWGSASRPRIQAKLRIGAVNDSLEHEADRVADHVMRMPSEGVTVSTAPPQISRKCAACEEESGSQVSSKCSACEEEGKVQKKAAGPEGHMSEAPEIVHKALQSPAHPLDAETRAFMEPRFGTDLSRVRVHDSGAAWESAQAINAYAYTVGQSIVFARGQFQTGTESGRRLLAHELTHVMQQSGASPARMPGSSAAVGRGEASEAAMRTGANSVAAAPGSVTASRVITSRSAAGLRVQRACGPREIGRQTDCVGRGGDITNFGGDSGKLFQFRVNCDDFLPGEEARIADLVSRLDGSAQVHIDGFSSEEGPAGYNEELSCARAKALAEALYGLGVSSSRISMLYKHGATPGDRPFHRSAVVTVDAAEEQQPPEDCGKYIGSCEFYLCRERQGHCGDKGYYHGYGHKYCERFTRLATHLSAPGKDWVYKTLRCLQEYIDQNIPIDAPCPEVRKKAFDSHPKCYVQSGVCFLDLDEMNRIMDTVDSADFELKQAIVTGVYCAGNWGPMAFPITSLSVGGGYGGLMERDRQRMLRLSHPPPVGRQ